MRNIRLILASSFLLINIFSIELLAVGNWSYRGFVDLRYQGGDKDKLSNGFVFNDAAIQVYGRYKNNYKVLIDVPVAWQGAADTDNDGIDDSFSNKWSVAQDRGQVYIVNEKEFYKILVGQFDSPLGYENNDSRDLFFAKQGLMFNMYTPTTHMGIKVEYKFFESFELHGLVSNSEGQGSQGGKLPEYALQFKFSVNDFYLLPGYYTRRVSGQQISLINVYGGFDNSIFMAQVEVNKLKDETLNEERFGYMLILGWKMSDYWSLALRGENSALLENKTGEQIDSSFQGSVAISYQVNHNLRILSDISFFHQKPLLSVTKDQQETTFSFQHSF